MSFAALALLLLVLAACTSTSAQVAQGVEATLTAMARLAPITTQTPRPSPTVAVARTETPAPTQTQQAAAGERARVTRVVDGDTIEVTFPDGRVERVRYIGMNTPEMSDSCGKDARDANELLVEDQEVLLIKDVSERDRYSRLLRYVYVGDLFVNEVLVANGWAEVATYPPDVKYVEVFLEAERIARENNYGIWGGDCNDDHGGPIPLPTGVSDTGYPGTCTGPDLDCGDFTSHAEAQAFFEMCGGPNADPHRLDGDHDGLVCETLP